MGAKTSPEMLKARKLIMLGVWPAEAARKCGITANAVYVSSWYKEWKAGKELEAISNACKEVGQDALP